MVHDFSKDDGLTAGDLFSLAERYHAFSGSDLATYTLPTIGASSASAGDVEVVQPDEAAQTITQFLGGPFGTISTPPVDAYGDPLDLTPPPPTTAPPSTAAPASTASGSAATPPPASNIPSYDPRPC